jgi:DNA-binding XRE family transcriptional regulator
MRAMERDWARLGAALQAARQARETNQVEMGHRIGISRGAIQNIERGNVKKITPSLRAFAREVGWTPESLEVVLAGGEPEMAAPPEERAQGDRAADLPLRIVRELGEGDLLDSTVIPLSDHGDGRMVIVVRGKPDATPDQIKQALLLWERRERQLRGVGDDENQPPSAEEA